ncbi:MAG: isoprenyl transferase [Desulfovibrionaceae bacterium]|nr:isoprenyl transferase [Desulfovibrionaceae bacterium]
MEDKSAQRLLPKHLALIMDGNGRWAKLRGLERSAGHRAGAENVYTIVSECCRLGIGYLTLYAFSSENWNRPKAEIQVLFSLLTDFLKRFLPTLQEQNIRLNALGDLEGLPLPQRAALNHVMHVTAQNSTMVLNLAINYGARQEIVRAVQAIIQEGLSASEITEGVLAAHLYTHGQPDPDLVIRTSGEQRLSNYLLYQSAYSEFYFTPTFWPDFGVAELHAALDDFATRNRRFGKTPEQISATREF